MQEDGPTGSSQGERRSGLEAAKGRSRWGTKRIRSTVANLECLISDEAVANILSAWHGSDTRTKERAQLEGIPQQTLGCAITYGPQWFNAAFGRRV